MWPGSVVPILDFRLQYDIGESIDFPYDFTGLPVGDRTEVPLEGAGDKKKYIDIFDNYVPRPLSG